MMQVRKASGWGAPRKVQQRLLHRKRKPLTPGLVPNGTLRRSVIHLMTTKSSQHSLKNQQSQTGKKVRKRQKKNQISMTFCSCSAPTPRQNRMSRQPHHRLTSQSLTSRQCSKSVMLRAQGPQQMTAVWNGQKWALAVDQSRRSRWRGRVRVMPTRN